MLNKIGITLFLIRVTGYCGIILHFVGLFFEKYIYYLEVSY